MNTASFDRRGFIASAAALTASLATGRALAAPLAKVRYLTPFGFLIGFAETMYAETGGFFAKQGLDVEIIGGRGSAMAVQQVAAGNVLLSRTGGTDHIKAYAKDPSLVAIAEIFQRDIFYVVSHRDHPVRTPDDLVGKTVGIVSPGGATENILDMMLAARDLSPDKAQRQSVGNAPSAFELVKVGRIAAYIATSDTVFQLQRQQQPILAWSTDEAAPCPGQVYMTSRATYEKKADELERFLRGVYDAIGAMLAAENNLAPVVDSMLTKYQVVEAKAPDKGVAVLKNGLGHTFAAPYRDKLASPQAQWASACDLMAKARIIPPLTKRNFYDDGVRAKAFA
ncbi:MAG: ABC transporter substrate-binding protein [Alphaproteobacteria bacterium]|nr:ABC transporter substrate-binding protein [Alphaproteobacteria bacterium]